MAATVASYGPANGHVHDSFSRSPTGSIDRPIHPLPRKSLRERLPKTSPLNSELATMRESLAEAQNKPSGGLFGNNAVSKQGTIFTPFSVGPNGAVISPIGHHMAGEYPSSTSSAGGVTAGSSIDYDSDGSDGALAHQHHHHHHHHLQHRHAEPELPPSGTYRMACAPGDALMSTSLTPTSATEPPVSPSTLADAYDWSENTNNKKKRKIPTLSGAHGVLSGGVGVPSVPGSSHDHHHHMAHSPGCCSTGSSPASWSSSITPKSRSKGRLGEKRTPLGSANLNLKRVASRKLFSTASSSTRPQDLENDPRPDGGSVSRLQKPSSEAATSAATDAEHCASKSSSAPTVLPTHQEDNEEEYGSAREGTISPSHVPEPPQASEFTFTCESETSQNFALRPPYSSGYYPQSSYSTPNTAPRNSVTTGTQTSPTITESSTYPYSGGVGTSTVPEPYATSQPAAPTVPPPSTTASVNTSQNDPAPPPKPRKPRRNNPRDYSFRRRPGEPMNNHQGSGQQEIWICEFCDYESIFGKPPMALIRQYEIKDRKERRRLAERQRLLEKAKQKSKNKSSGKKKKGAGKNNVIPAPPPATPTNGAAQLPPDQQVPPPEAETHTDSQGTQYDDGYDDNIEVQPLYSQPPANHAPATPIPATPRVNEPLKPG